MRKALMGIVVAIAFGVAGCGEDERKSGSDASGEVSFMVFGDPDEIQGFKNMIAAYENEQPDVNVEMIEAADRDDLIARLSTSFAGGTPPDLFLLNYRYLGQFVSKDVLEPVEDRVDDSDVFQQEDFYEEAMKAFRFDDKLTCLPQNISSLVVYYNKDMFEKAGVATPKAGWKWDDMVAPRRSCKRPTARSTVSGWSRRSSGSHRSSGRTAGSSSTTTRTPRISSSTRPRRRMRWRTSSS